MLCTLCSLKKRSISSLSPPAQLTSRWRSWSTGRSFWKIWLPYRTARSLHLVYQIKTLFCHTITRLSTVYATWWVMNAVLTFAERRTNFCGGILCCWTTIGESVMGICSLFRGLKILVGLSSLRAQRAQECPSTLDIICNRTQRKERHIVGFLLTRLLGGKTSFYLTKKRSFWPKCTCIHKLHYREATNGGNTPKLNIFIH